MVAIRQMYHHRGDRATEQSPNLKRFSTEPVTPLILAGYTRGMIVDWIFDTARSRDSNHIDQLTEPERTAVYADSAYASKDCRQRLKENDIADQIVHKRVRGQAEQKRHNTACSRVRAFVERPQAWIVKMGYTMARCRGLTRNALDFTLMSIAYDFKRSFHLLGQSLTPARSG